MRVFDAKLPTSRSKVCAGYFDGDMLFEVCGLIGRALPVPRYVANTFAALTRGAPTCPSPYLVKSMGLDWDKVPKEPLVLISSSPVDWCETVRGAPDGYNPALEFLQGILPTVLGQWSFVTNLIVPEYPLFGCLDAPEGLTEGPNDRAVDFYLPQADLVLEIDGGQHEDARQRHKDLARDRFLQKFGIKTLRLKTSDLRARNSVFNDFILALLQRCEDSPRLKPYRTFVDNRKSESLSLRHDLTAVLRLQVAIMLAISHRQLDLASPEWHLTISHDFQSRSQPEWITAALCELFDWFSLFSRLDGDPFIPPDLRVGPGGMPVDIRLFDRPDDAMVRKAGLTVCTSAVQGHPVLLKYPDRIIWNRNFGLSALRSDNFTRAGHTLPSLEDLSDLSHRVFGHESFRPGQDTLILNAISGQKSLGLMPTGGGKSLCFQVPALLGPGTTIVVVPIKALGRDHCAELEKSGFTGRVVNIDSDMPAVLRDEIYARRILNGEMRFVFVSPERFQSDKFRQIVRGLREQGQLRMFVIDEVHCMSEWGHDFRPSYLTLPGTLRSVANDVPVLGLTATASVNVLRDIQNEFEIPDELIAYEMHRSRTELNFSIREALSTPDQVAREVREIVATTEGNLPPPLHIFSRYVNGSSGTERLSTMLANDGLGLRVGMFSGSAPKDLKLDNAFDRLLDQNLPRPKTYDDYKQTVQTLWKDCRLDVIVTTKAFGMGVNKPDVRHTLHAGMPSSMEAFYQEAGRAGRDRQPATCHMLFRPEPDNAEEIFLRIAENLTPEGIKSELEHPGGRRKSPAGDLRAQLWFMAQGLISVEEELVLVKRLHGLLQSDPADVQFIQARQLSDIAQGGLRFQMTLYRLYQMGLIAPWSVTDWGLGSGEELSVQAVEVRRLDATYKSACRSVMARIQAVDGKGAETAVVSQLKSMLDGPQDWMAIYRLLLDWVRRKQLGGRLESTWNLYRECNAFKPERAVEFRNDLEAFFKVDSNAFQLAALRDMPTQEVVDALDAMLVVKGDDVVATLRPLSAQLTRLLEGTQDNPGLNLASFCFQLVTEVQPGQEARMRFRAAVPNGPLSFWMGPGRKLFARIASISPVGRDIIGKWLIEDQPDRQTLLEIYEAIPAPAVHKALLDEFATDLALIV